MAQTAGNVTFDGNNWYSYDGDGRLCSLQTTGPTSGLVAYGYIYDAEGRRVAKGTIAVTSTPLVCNPNTATNGFQLTESYVLDQSGQELTMLDQNGKPQRTNVFAGSQLLATYDSTDLHFHLTDPLGTRRMQVTSAGAPEGRFQSLPFGDKLTSSGNDATPLHFTGKERDAESGLDYFGARYYASNMGRFMSPDPSQLYYANPFDPQSLNLYSYGRNNPLTNVDPTGLDCVYINNDTGKFENFSAGDCDNSTDAKANSGYYVDGTVNQISFNGQNQVIGYSATSGDGIFDSFAGSTSADVGPAAVNLNPYTNALSSPGQTVNVNGNSPVSSNLNSANISNLIPAGYKPPPPGVHIIGPNPTRPTPNLAGDPSCFGAPDAVSDIHNVARGQLQNAPQGSTDGSFGTAIYQNTTQGNRPFGNAGADAGFAAGFMGLDYATSVANCLQGH